MTPAEQIIMRHIEKYEKMKGKAKKARNLNETIIISIVIDALKQILEEIRDAG